MGNGRLTQAEKEIIREMGRTGVSQRKIADATGVSRNTVRYHLSPAYNKGQKERMKRQVLSIGGGIRIYGLNKRPLPASGLCELCDRAANHLGYHHWDRGNPNLGLWICEVCHRIVESVDLPNFLAIVDKYFHLKLTVSTGPKWNEACLNPREYYRRTTLCLGDGNIIRGLNKRLYPEGNICELCNKEARCLGYHHWDDNEPSIGIYVCTTCHRVAESIENRDFPLVADKYFYIRGNSQGSSPVNQSGYCQPVSCRPVRCSVP